MTDSTRFNLPNPLGHAPLRRAQSVRRTTNIDMTWPNGRGKTMRFDAIGRDVFTHHSADAPALIQRDQLTASISADRYIEAIDVVPARSNIGNLIGERGGNHLRTALVEKLPDEARNGSPLYLLLDDLSGTSLIAGWAWSLWPNAAPHPDHSPEKIAQIKNNMENVCIGFATGSSALLATTKAHATAAVIPLEHPDDIDGWQPLQKHTDVSMRRARRIDVWLDGGIHVDAMFQDSASDPSGGRVAIHEYSLKLTADANTQIITHIEATPHVLPFPECPSATNNMRKLLGKPIGDLRQLVLENLRKTAGCTHLNDALRSLAEVPVLLKALNARC